MDHQVLQPDASGGGSRTPGSSVGGHVNKEELEAEINELQMLPLAPPSPAEESPPTHVMVKRSPTTNMVSQKKQAPTLKKPPPGYEAILERRTPTTKLGSNSDSSSKESSEKKATAEPTADHDPGFGTVWMGDNQIQPRLQSISQDTTGKQSPSPTGSSTGAVDDRIRVNNFSALLEEQPCLPFPEDPVTGESRRYAYDRRSEEEYHQDRRPYQEYEDGYAAAPLHRSGREQHHCRRLGGNYRDDRHHDEPGPPERYEHDDYYQQPRPNHQLAPRDRWHHGHADYPRSQESGDRRSHRPSRDLERPYGGYHDRERESGWHDVGRHHESSVPRRRQPPARRGRYEHEEHSRRHHGDDWRHYPSRQHPDQGYSHSVPPHYDDYIDSHRGHDDRRAPSRYEQYNDTEDHRLVSSGGTAVQYVNTDRAKEHGTTDANKAVYVEIAPGVKEPLRRTAETMTAVSRDFFIPASCFACSADLFCIADVKYIICPACQTISPAEAATTSSDDGGVPVPRQGVGLGFTFETLFQMQSSLVQEGKAAFR